MGDHMATGFKAVQRPLNLAQGVKANEKLAWRTGSISVSRIRVREVRRAIDRRFVRCIVKAYRLSGAATIGSCERRTRTRSELSIEPNPKRRAWGA